MVVNLISNSKIDVSICLFLPLAFKISFDYAVNV